MLFDLTSPRRRRVVRVVFGSLAAVFAISFVFLGIGSGINADFTGPLGDLLGTNDADEVGFEEDIKDAEERTQANPKDAQAWLELAEAHLLQAAREGDTDDQGFTIPNSDAGSESAQAVDAWEKYLALKPKKPDPSVAGQMSSAYLLANGILLSPDGSGQLAVAFGEPTVFEAQQVAAGAARAQEIAAAGNPSANTFGTLALFHYYAGNVAEGDRAAQQALGTLEGAEAEGIQQTLKNYARLGELLAEQVVKAEKAQQQAGAGSPEEAAGSLDQLGGGLDSGGTTLAP